MEIQIGSPILYNWRSYTSHQLINWKIFAWWACFAGIRAYLNIRFKEIDNLEKLNF